MKLDVQSGYHLIWDLHSNRYCHYHRVVLANLYLSNDLLVYFYILLIPLSYPHLFCLIVNELYRFIISAFHVSSICSIRSFLHSAFNQLIKYTSSLYAFITNYSLLEINLVSANALAIKGSTANLLPFI